jgi:hypothetical protein
VGYCESLVMWLRHLQSLETERSVDAVRMVRHGRQTPSVGNGRRRGF